jgi:hypothetical protein
VTERTLVDEFERGPHAGGLLGEAAIDGKQRGQNGERGADVNDVAGGYPTEATHGTLPFEGMCELSVISTQLSVPRGTIYRVFTAVAARQR